jgi:hypothetical protein
MGSVHYWSKPDTQWEFNEAARDFGKPNEVYGMGIEKCRLLTVWMLRHLFPKREGDDFSNS